MPSISPPRTSPSPGTSNGNTVSTPSTNSRRCTTNCILREATIPERHACWSSNSSAWKGPLTEQAYFLREAHLGTTDLTREEGMKYWVLVDPATAPSPPTSPDGRRRSSAVIPNILSACETIRKPSLVVRKDGTTEEVVAYGIGGVFTSEQNRGCGYAKAMMGLLGERLKELDYKGKRSGFSVLYSDIGKKFYARLGWLPHPSSHLALPAIGTPTSSSATPSVTLLTKDSLPNLCRIDTAHVIRESTSLPFSSSTNARVIQLPTVEIMDWHHAREEFVGQYTVGRVPTIKGAYTLLDGENAGEETGENAVWAIWSHDFTDLKLFMLRLHIPTLTSSNTSAVKSAILRILHAAQLEAGEWEFKEVQAWNPVTVVLETATGIEGWEMVDREEGSIASLMWYGDHGEKGEVEPEGIEWGVNEKYTWC